MPKIKDTELEASSCSLCGATRPLMEFRSEQGCMNCANLKLMADSIRDAEKNKAESLEKDKRLTEEIKNLPELEKFISLLYDNERGVCWLGVNLKEEKCDPVTLLFKIDEMKMHFMVNLLDWKQREQKRKNLVISVPDRARKVVSEIRRRGVEVSDRVKELFTLNS